MKNEMRRLTVRSDERRLVQDMYLFEALGPSALHGALEERRPRAESRLRGYSHSPNKSFALLVVTLQVSLTITRSS